MPTIETCPPTIAPADLFTVLAPTSAGPLTIAPLVSNSAAGLEYLGLGSALVRGVEVDEVGVEGDVGSVMVRNPLGLPVLLYDGEQIVGAKQDRILNLSVLIPAGGVERVPVSCVEHGRWRRVSARFDSSDHTAAPSVRRGKAEALRGDARGTGRAQQRVWSEVGSMATRVGAYSPTGAFSDVIATLRPRIDDLARRFALVPGQCGVLVAIAGRPVCLDVVSRADVFADLWPRLLTGYAADAIDAPAGRPIRRRHFIELLHVLGSLPLSYAPSVGLGSNVRGATDDVELTGLVHEGAVVQLSAYARH